MAEENGATSAKAKTEVTKVTMSDGREVGFPGKRRLQKDYTVDADGKVTATFDFVNGETRSFYIAPGAPLYGKFAGHGAVQKIGDETAGDETVDDMVLHVDAILTRLNAGEWGIERAAGDSFSGAAIVIRAIMEATNKDLTFVKGFLEKKLEDGKAAGLTRQKLYLGYRKNPRVAPIIERMEREKAAAAAPAVDVSADLEEMETAPA